MTMRPSDLDKACTGIFGFLLGHEFQPKYDQPSPVLLDSAMKAVDDRSSAIGSARIINSYRARIYRGDACRRCGEVRNSRPVDAKE